MTALPPGWRWATIDDVAGGIRSNVVIGPFGSSLKVSDYQDSGVPLVFVRNIRLQNFDDLQRYVSSDKAAELAAHQAKNGDVLVTKMGEPPGDAALYRRHEHAIITADCIRVRPSNNVLPQYLTLVLGADTVRSQMISITRGVAQKKVSLERFRTIRIPLPPIAEQHRIVESLENRLSRLDEATRAIRRSDQRIHRVIDAQMEAALQGDWPEVRISDIATVGSGATPLKSRRDYYDQGTVPWVTSGALNSSVIESPSGYITELAVRETAVRLWPVGTLLVAMYGEGKTRGRCGELAIPATTNQACAAINLDIEHANLQPWVKLILRSRYQRMRRLASGGVQPNLSLGVIKSIAIPIPPPQVRASIIASVDTADEVVVRTSQELRAVIKRASQLRRSLLNAAFAGRLTNVAAVSTTTEFASV